jgi:hypothetical protein
MTTTFGFQLAARRRIDSGFQPVSLNYIEISMIYVFAVLFRVARQRFQQLTPQR